MEVEYICRRKRVISDTLSTPDPPSSHNPLPTRRIKQPVATSLNKRIVYQFNPRSEKFANFRKWLLKRAGVKISGYNEDREVRSIFKRSGVIESRISKRGTKQLKFSFLDICMEKFNFKNAHKNLNILCQIIMETTETPLSSKTFFKRIFHEQ